MALENELIPPAADPAAPPAPTTPAEQVATKGGKLLPLSTTTIEKLKRENQEKGRRAALSDIEKKAKELGFDSVDAMYSAARAGKNNGQQRQQQGKKPKPKPNGQNGQPPKTQNANGRTDPRWEKERLELRERADRDRRERIKAQRKAEEKEHEAWAADAQRQLERIALQSGVRDPEYAVSLWTRECELQRQMLDEAGFDKWLAAADEKEYFAGLRKTRPALFEEVVVAATTGTVTQSTQHPPPGAGQVTQAEAKGARTDVRKMSKDDYQAKLSSLGLKIPQPGG